MKNITMKKVLVALIAGAMLGLGGCGGSGAGAGGQPEGAQAAKDAQDTRIMLSASSQELLTDSTAPIDLTAVVTDSESGVAISGQVVEFSTRDAGVRIEVSRAETDASGVALARLFLNGDATPRSVTVMAAVGQQAPAEIIISVTAKATSQSSQSSSSRGELSVRIGTDNLIEDVKETLSYRKRYAVIVTDNAGISQANASISATLRAFSYRVGYWVKAGDWVPRYLDTYDPVSGAPQNFDYPLSYVHPQGAPTGIPTEDMNNLGFCDPEEDWNGDGVLTPGNVASYTIQSLTDSNGVAVMNIVYPKSFAMWANLQLEVTAVVGGTEGKNAIFIPLPIAAEDVKGDSPPPSISRTRGSLSSPKMLFPIDASEVLEPQDVVNGSPFPYWSGVGSRPTCSP